MVNAVIALTTLYLTTCVDLHFVSVNEDFTKVETDEKLAKYVSQITDRLKTFKVRGHPRIWLFYHLLKKGIASYSEQTEDTIFVPLKYSNMDKISEMLAAGLQARRPNDTQTTTKPS